MGRSCSAVPLTAAVESSLQVLDGVSQPLELLLDFLDPASVLFAKPATFLVRSAAASEAVSTSGRQLLGEFADHDRPFVVPELAPQFRRHLQQLDLLADAWRVPADHRRFVVAAPLGVHLHRVDRALDQFGRIAAVCFEQRRYGEPHDLDAVADVAVRTTPFTAGLPPAFAPTTVIVVGPSCPLGTVPTHLAADFVGDASEHVQFALSLELFQRNHSAFEAVEDLLQVWYSVRLIGVRMAPHRRTDKDADRNGRTRPHSIGFHHWSSSVHP